MKRSKKHNEKLKKLKKNFSDCDCEFLDADEDEINFDLICKKPLTNYKSGVTYSHYEK